MRFIFGSIAAPLLVLLGIACSTVSPDECWINTSGGFGGSGTIPIGAGVGATSGDYLEPPRGPLDYGDAPNPCVMPQSPCDQKCLDAYEVAAIACGKIIKDDAQYKTCSEGAYAAYKSCHVNCQQIDIADCRERCKKQCDKIHDRCHANCNKNDPTSSCHAECNNEYGTCLKECDQDCKGN
jgi:hypothetical protein